MIISELWPAEPGPRARRLQSRRRMAGLLGKLAPGRVDRVLGSLVADQPEPAARRPEPSSEDGTPRRERSRLSRDRDDHGRLGSGPVLDVLPAVAAQEHEVAPVVQDFFH